jgi:hypothetical protein
MIFVSASVGALAALFGNVVIAGLAVIAVSGWVLVWRRP